MDMCAAQDTLLAVIQPIALKRRVELERFKRECRKGLQRPDFLWHYMLQSFATMGKAAGSKGLIGDQENYSRVRYEALVALSPKKREAEVFYICRVAGVRMPAKKAEFILECFDQIRNLGGPIEAKELLLAEKGRDAKIKFLMRFHGIGPKYARNIMMDVYHKDFRESIAIDVRIKSISDALGLAFGADYLLHETFYLEVAHRAGMNGWEFDRLLFNFSAEVKAGLSALEIADR